MHTHDIIRMYFAQGLSKSACSCAAQEGLKQIDNKSCKQKNWSKHLFLVHHLKGSLLKEAFAKPEHLSHGHARWASTGPQALEPTLAMRITFVSLCRRVR